MKRYAVRTQKKIYLETQYLEEANSRLKSLVGNNKMNRRDVFLDDRMSSRGWTKEDSKEWREAMEEIK